MARSDCVCQFRLLTVLVISQACTHQCGCVQPQGLRLGHAADDEDAQQEEERSREAVGEVAPALLVLTLQLQVAAHDQESLTHDKPAGQETADPQR